MIFYETLCQFNSSFISPSKQKDSSLFYYNFVCKSISWLNSLGNDQSNRIWNCPSEWIILHKVSVVDITLESKRVSYRACLTFQPQIFLLEEPSKWEVAQVHAEYPKASESYDYSCNVVLWLCALWVKQHKWLQMNINTTIMVNSIFSQCLPTVCSCGEAFPNFKDIAVFRAVLFMEKNDTKSCVEGKFFLLLQSRFWVNHDCEDEVLTSWGSQSCPSQVILCENDSLHRLHNFLIP